MISIESSDDEDELHAALALSLQQQPNNNDNTNNNVDDSSDDEVEFIGTNSTTVASTSSTLQNNKASCCDNKKDEKIDMLMSMGFNRSTCINALQQTNGNLENAISFIVDSSGSSSVMNQNQSPLTESVANSKVSSNDDKITAAINRNDGKADNKQSATSASNSNKSSMSLADIRVEKHRRYLLSQQNNTSSSNQQQQQQNGTSSSSMLNPQSDNRSINQMSSTSCSARASSNVSLDGQVQVVNNNLIDTNKVRRSWSYTPFDLGITQ